ncbi:hypothetical protein EMPS_08463 [Entomortierella parvispora]|uniref:Uncharacterized protein n=1 Tax=Entomortierella parvispora TaxID=205924 RepID=A0A9P3LZB3_9FUNG|nr:hypothetical protein EMPS_08463 [Entomortierella parvispora]
MAAFVRSMARIATRASASAPRVVVRTRQAPAVMIARQYHAFRPTDSVLKSKKHAIMDDDDEELEAELAALEQEKRELEALEKGETLQDNSNSEDSSSSAASSQFQEKYDAILEKTQISTPVHQLPRHTALYHLLKTVTTADQAAALPELVQQWRQRKLPITPLISDKLIQAVCHTTKAQSPEIAIQLLGDREVYGLSPGQGTVRRVVRSFVRGVEDAVGAGNQELALEKLDGAFKTMALMPYYNLPADDFAVYSNLIRGSLALGSEEGQRRAEVTMDELLLINGEKEEPLTRKRAAEVVAAAEALHKVYEANGKQDKAEELNKAMAQWRKNL